MKPLFVAASLALGLCACSESPPVIQILSSKVPTATCSIEEDAPGRAAGFLNLAFGQSYVLGLLVNSSYSNTPTEVSGVPLDPAPGTGGQGTAFVDTVEVSYATTPNIRLPNQKIAYTAGISPNSEENKLVLDLLTREAADALLAAVPAGGTPVQVQVTLKLTGKFLSGGGKFESNEFIYVFEAFNRPISIPACPAGESPEPVAPCGSSGGQDGNYPNCI